MTTKSIYDNAKYENDAAFLALSKMRNAVARRNKSIWAISKYSYFNDCEEERSETKLLNVPESIPTVNNRSEDDCRVDNIEHRKKAFPHFERRVNTLRQSQGHATPNGSDKFIGRIPEVNEVESVPTQQSRMKIKYLNSSPRNSPPQAENGIHIQKKSTTSEHAQDEFSESIWDIHPIHAFQRQENSGPTNKINKKLIANPKTSPQLTRKDTMEQSQENITGTKDGSQEDMTEIKDSYHTRVNPVYFNKELGQKLNSEKSLEKCNKHVQNHSSTQNLICLKIRTDTQYFEFFTNLLDLTRIKRKFSKFSEALPDVDATPREVKHSADAMKIIFGFLFNHNNDFSAVSNGRMAIEALSASRSWEMHNFHAELQEHFLRDILLQGNVYDLYSVAHHLGEHELCEAIKNTNTENDSIETATVRYRKKKCSVSVQTYIESKEFSFPLNYVPPCLTSYEDNFNRDIRNEIIFEAISSCYEITGFQIHFNLKNVNAPSDYLKIDYSATNIYENISIEEQKNKPLRSKIIIYFKQEVTVKPGQKCKVSVEMEVKPFLCCSLEENVVEENTHKGRFYLSMSSTFKVKNSKTLRFFVDKLFYRESNAFGNC